MIWSNFLVQSFELGAQTAPLQRGPVLGGSLSAVPQSCACAHHHVCLSTHMIQFPVKASFSAEKGAVIHWKSWNPDCWVTLPWPTSSPWPGKFVGAFDFLVVNTCVLCPSWLSLSLSLPGALSKWVQQTLTQALCSYFSPNAHKTWIFQAASSVGQVDNRHPLIQTATVSAEPVHFAQCGVLPQWRLRILQEERQSSYHLLIYEMCKHLKLFKLHNHRRQLFHACTDNNLKGGEQRAAGLQ